MNLAMNTDAILQDLTAKLRDVYLELMKVHRDMGYRNDDGTHYVGLHRERVRLEGLIFQFKEVAHEVMKEGI